MHLDLPADCGNAPRTTIVAEFVAAWAAGDDSVTGEWLADDSTWTRLGTVTVTDRPDRVELLSVLTHGRLAACDGFFFVGETRVDFSHVFRFTGAAKTAKIASLRTYWVESAAG